MKIKRNLKKKKNQFSLLTMKIIFRKKQLNKLNQKKRLKNLKIKEMNFIIIMIQMRLY